MSPHQPVMLDEVLGCWFTDPGGVYLDCTYGRGGHSRALLDRLNASARLFVIDRDPEAVEHAHGLADQDTRVVPLHGAFSDIDRLLTTAGGTALTGVLFDLGVSSPQLDQASRGFSFSNDGPLDMRMDNSTGPTAAEWLNSATVEEMAGVFRRYGEERHAARIARAVERARPLATTQALADVVERAQPRRAQARGPVRHGATRVFQAIRIHINAELDEIGTGLDVAFNRLITGGRLVALSFHSLEDRLVKQAFRALTRPDPGPRRLPLRGAPPVLARAVAGPVKATAREVHANPRARSATLRAIERVAVATGPGAGG